MHDSLKLSDQLDNFLKTTETVKKLKDYTVTQFG